MLIEEWRRCRPPTDRNSVRGLERCTFGRTSTGRVSSAAVSAAATSSSASGIAAMVVQVENDTDTGPLMRSMTSEIEAPLVMLDDEAGSNRQTSNEHTHDRGAGIAVHAPT